MNNDVQECPVICIIGHFTERELTQDRTKISRQIFSKTN